MTTSKKNILSNQSGFSLLEIIVALVLIVVIVTLIPFGGADGEHDKLKETMTKIQRASRFSVNESILRNVIVRIKFNLDVTPTEYTIEYGKKSDLVLPETQDLSNLSIKEREAADEGSKKFDNQFNPVTEFSDEAKTIPDVISFYGLGTTYYSSLISEGSPSLYFYPTGERDSAIIFLYTPVEIAALEISPFEDTMRESYYKFSPAELENFEYSLESKAREIFEAWLRK